MGHEVIALALETIYSTIYVEHNNYLMWNVHCLHHRRTSARKGSESVVDKDTGRQTARTAIGIQTLGLFMLCLCVYFAQTNTLV